MKKIILLGAALACSLAPQAQSTQSFQEFRQQILDDYQEFRRTILSHYADFLEGTWHEYQPLEPLKKDDKPKPIKVPDVKLSKPSVNPKTLPTPKIHSIPLPERPLVAEEPTKPEPAVPDLPAPDARPGSLLDLPPVAIPPEALGETPTTLKVRPDMGTPLLADFPHMPAPIPEPEPSKLDTPEGPSGMKVTPTLPADPTLAERNSIPELPHFDEEIFEDDDLDGKEIVKFYGMDIPVPRIDFQISNSLEKASDLARHWKILEEQDLAEQVDELLMPTIKKLGLNDYLTYEFLCAYMDSKFPQAGLAPRVSAVHYILANQGLGARIAIAVQTGDPLILMPSKQTIYGKVYFPINGENYYVMAPAGTNLNNVSITTCDLPKVADAARKFDFRINGLNLPVKERQFDVNHGSIRLTGVMNENLMPVVYRYPQMETEDFAVSYLDKNMRDDLVRQIREQLGDKEKLKATNELLQFTQSGFEYSTDDNFHGFEKPYFLEENFYYPYNDCEDRAIFYTYMLWNALGVENQMLFFPGHESASVSIPEATNLKGTSYVHDGKRYFISDPTYIGSFTGMCMPAYETTAPEIDHSYPDK